MLIRVKPTKVDAPWSRWATLDSQTTRMSMNEMRVGIDVNDIQGVSIILETGLVQCVPAWNGRGMRVELNRSALRHVSVSPG